MKDSIKNQILIAKKSNEVGYVSFFNDGSVSTDNFSETDRLKENYCTDVTIDSLKNFLCNSAKYYTLNGDFNYLESFLRIGIIFNKKDVDDDNHVKDNAKPIRDVVRVYNGEITSYLDGNQTNLFDFGKYGYGFQGFAKYDELVKQIKENGLSFKGPQNYKDFLCAMVTDIPFEIKIGTEVEERTNSNKKLTR